jgi:zinc transport system ATP-binding protein
LDCLLEVKNLSFSYPGKTLFSDLSFTVKNRDRLLVTGPNGSGKTTLLKLILGNLKPTGGTITRAQDLRIAYCKQDFPNLDFPISAGEVVRMGLYGQKIDRSEDLARRAMEKTNCLHLEKRLFPSLSGGERQRVSLARCLCQNAHILLLDEPSSFLDSESEQTLIEIMGSLEDSNFAIIAVTHDSAITQALKWKQLRMGQND